MRSSLIVAGRTGLSLVLIAALLNVPPVAGSDKPLGVVVASQRARLDNANAVAGVDVYTGDTFATDTEGSLRLAIGKSQMFLLASSSAQLHQQETKVRATLDHGTLGFSTSAPDQIEIATPLATVRGLSGGPVYGQVAVIASDKMIVSASQGSLLVAADDQEQIIKPGQTYAVSFAPDAAGGSAGDQGVIGTRKNRKRLAFLLITAGAVATAAAVTWHEASESCSNLNCD